MCAGAPGIENWGPFPSSGRSFVLSCLSSQKRALWDTMLSEHPINPPVTYYIFISYINTIDIILIVVPPEPVRRTTMGGSRRNVSPWMWPPIGPSIFGQSRTYFRRKVLYYCGPPIAARLHINTTQYNAIQCNTMQYNALLRGTIVNRTKYC